MTLPRRTIHTDTDQYAGFTLEIPNDRTDQLQGYQEHMIRRLMTTIEENGFTTHLDVIRANLDLTTPIFAAGSITPHHWSFPPRQPRVGQPARIDGGHGHRGRFTIEHPAQDISDVTVNILGSERTVTVHRYGFDTATGEWVFTDSFWMGP